MTNQPSWMTAEYMHMPVSTSEMFVYQPVGDVDAVWATVATDEDYPLRVELFTPDDQEIGLRLTARTLEFQYTVPEGSCINLDFANIPQRDAFFRMIVELADWIKEHHHGNLPTV
jgi:hypothetical protein